MKKIFTAILLSLALFSVACSDADKALEKYDFSSPEAFEKSFVAQCEKDGVDEDHAAQTCVFIMLAEYDKDLMKILAIKDEKEQAEEFLKLMKKAIGNRSPKEVMVYAKKVYDKKGYGKK